MSKPAFGLGERNDLLLEGREPAIGEGADHDLAAGRPGRRGSQGGRERRAERHAGAGLEKLPPSFRFSVHACSLFLPCFASRWTMVEPEVSKKHASAGSKVTPISEPTAARKPLRARADTFSLAETDDDQRLVAHGLDDIDFVHGGLGVRRRNETDVLGPNADFGDCRRMPHLRARHGQGQSPRRAAHLAVGRAALTTFIGGLPTKSRDEAVGGPVIDFFRRAELLHGAARMTATRSAMVRASA